MSMVLADCQYAPAPQLGTCVAPSPASGTYATTVTYRLSDGSTLQLKSSPPSFQRSDPAGTVRYLKQLDLDQIDLLWTVEIRGDATYVSGIKSSVESVARLDVAIGTVAWDAPLIAGGAPL